MQRRVVELSLSPQRKEKLRTRSPGLCRDGIFSASSLPDYIISLREKMPFRTASHSVTTVLWVEDVQIGRIRMED